MAPGPLCWLWICSAPFDGFAAIVASVLLSPSEFAAIAWGYYCSSLLLCWSLVGFLLALCCCPFVLQLAVCWVWFWFCPLVLGLVGASLGLAWGFAVGSAVAWGCLMVFCPILFQLVIQSCKSVLLPAVGFVAGCFCYVAFVVLLLLRCAFGLGCCWPVCCIVATDTVLLLLHVFGRCGRLVFLLMSSSLSLLLCLGFGFGCWSCAVAAFLLCPLGCCSLWVVLLQFCFTSVRRFFYCGA